MEFIFYYLSARGSRSRSCVWLQVFSRWPQVCVNRQSWPSVYLWIWFKRSLQPGQCLVATISSFYTCHHQCYNRSLNVESKQWFSFPRLISVFHLYLQLYDQSKWDSCCYLDRCLVLLEIWFHFLFQAFNVSCNISNMKDRVWPHFQTPRRE